MPLKKPVCKLSRRLATDLSLKSRARDITTKCKLNVRPGQHGGKKPRISDYRRQLEAKQAIREMYGIKEGQFRKYYKSADRIKGATGENLLQLLECRLDNVIYRLGFGSTRAESRQLVTHKAVTVDGQLVFSPSYHVKPGAVVEIRDSKKKQERIGIALKLAADAGIPDWVSVDSEAKSGKLMRKPERAELPQELNEQYVVELYSK